MRSAVIGLSLLFLIAIATCTLQGQTLPPRVSINQVVANPKDYDGKRITVIGYLEMAREGDMLFAHREDSENMIYENALSIERSERKREQLLSASITVASAKEIEELFDGYQAAGVTFHQKLKDEEWGARTFVVEDPDGNLVLFAGPASE